MIDSVDVPPGVPDDVVTVSVDVPDPLIDDGLNVAVAHGLGASTRVHFGGSVTF